MLNRCAQERFIPLPHPPHPFRSQFFVLRRELRERKAFWTDLAIVFGAVVGVVAALSFAAIH
ncbi:MAG TPA: hypothetical protein VGR84_18705 [Candidatus Acidoferrales bacterium]|nr:hypothetical protein [Candidatus Acidoferrales bacterium]